MKTQGNVYDYENICLNCQKKIVSSDEYYEIMDVHQTMVIEPNDKSGFDEPINYKPRSLTE